MLRDFHAFQIAEGSGKRTPQDQRRFYSIALGSLRECEAVLELEEIEDKELLQWMDHLEAPTEPKPQLIQVRYRTDCRKLLLQ